MIPRPVALITRAVFIETFRRNEFWVVAILMGLFTAGVLIARMVGIESPAVATFLLNLGMSCAAGFAAVITVLGSVRQVPNELENRTIYPLMAKPVSRGQFLLGKWLAVSLGGIATYLLLLIPGYLPVPRLESFDTILLVQLFLVQCVALSAIAGLGVLLSLLIPRALNLVLLLTTVFGAGALTRLLREQFGEGAFGGVVRVVTAYIPDFSILALTRRYTDGIAALPLDQFLGLVAYAALLAGFSLCLAVWRFERQPL